MTVAIIFGLILELQAQKKEFGVGIGGLAYTGDLISTYKIESNRPAINTFYRHNFNYGTALRTSILAGQLKASDQAFGKDIFARNRNHGFDIALIEASLIFEYNFLDFRNPKERTPISPYVLFGAGATLMTGHKDPVAEFSPIQLNIPFGVGVKYALDRYWLLSLEFAARKLFTDYLDNLSAPQNRIKNYQTGNKYDTDYYYFASFSVSYTLWSVHCPYDFY